MRPVSDDDLWETHADWWQDGFTDGVDPEYEEQILPLAEEHLRGARRVLDIGTGEGQVARLAARLGAEVVGLDPTWNQVEVAKERAGGPVYLRSGAADLPFPDASFDVAVACLVFEHIDDVDEAIAEVARVLEPGGRFLFFLNHPLLQTPNSGWIDDQILEPPEQYWRIGAYLREDKSIEEVQKDVYIPFIHRPLQPLPQRAHRQRTAADPHRGAGPATRVPGPGARVHRRVGDPPPAVPAHREAPVATGTLTPMGDYVVIAGLSGAGR